MGGLVDGAALGITADVQWESHLGGKLSTLFQHGIDGVGIHVGVFGNLLEFVSNLEHFVQHKLHVAQGRVYVGMGFTLGGLGGNRGKAAWGAWAPKRARMLSKPVSARAMEPGFFRKRPRSARPG